MTARAGEDQVEVLRDWWYHTGGRCGRITWFLDEDEDYWLPGLLEAALDFWSLKTLGKVLVYADLRIIACVVVIRYVGSYEIHNLKATSNAESEIVLAPMQM